ncbi:hypothetical protein LTR62_003804 [Meristemomyces frigidus]|uniref:HCNGP-domain-containing protein n=1 Tax=Meristemomyces frigidus TaxID=1508187 RepID=A0AAN7YRM1_9PEZI|nr:hypothetical protein LTR62_003804 [Meristemomyces frigidus]
MSPLVGYGSSDEDEGDIRPEQTAKIATAAKLDNDGSTVEHEHHHRHVSQAPAPLPASPRTAAEAPTSPYTTERLSIRNLTMPPFPNFSIPDEPAAPPPHSEAAAALAARTKKFEHFLELKKKGIHFNRRLQDSASLRNPSLLPKLMDFAGIEKDGSYKGTLAVEDGGVPGHWPGEWYVESLVKGNERREKKRAGEKSGVEFVAAKKGKRQG